MKKFKKIRKLKDYRIHREGTGLILGSFVVFAAALSALWYFLPTLVVTNAIISAFFLVIFLLIVNFFRSPKRLFPGDVDNVVVAPADGKVVVIEKVYEPDHFKDERIQVSIFMSPLNVHANWYPVDGVVTRVEHQKGKFHKAWLPKASTENERSLVVVKMADGREILVRQIAGAMARTPRLVRSALLTNIWALSSSAHVSMSICLSMPTLKWNLTKRPLVTKLLLQTLNKILCLSRNISPTR